MAVRLGVVRGVGNAAFGLVLLIAGLVAVVHRSIPARDGELALTTALLMLPLWPALLIGLGTAVATGAFDWTTRSRGLQYAVVSIAGTAMVGATFLVAGVLAEPTGDTPPIVDHLLGVAGFLLPGIAGASGLVALNAPRRATVAWRTSLVLLGGGSSIALAALLAIATVDNLRHDVQAADADASARAARDVASLAEVDAMDPVADFVALLRYTNVFNPPALRDAALKKIGRHPAFADAMTAVIRDGGCDEALTFLEGETGPDPAALARPASDAIACIAARTRDEFRHETSVYDVNLDATTRRALGTADRFAAWGVDYRPSVRLLRAVMDEPNRSDLKPSCRATLDRWLQAHDGKAP